jgi:hypothetical protein
MSADADADAALCRLTDQGEAPLHVVRLVSHNASSLHHVSAAPHEGETRVSAPHPTHSHARARTDTQETPNEPLRPWAGPGHLKLFCCQGKGLLGKKKREHLGAHWFLNAASTGPGFVPRPAGLGPAHSHRFDQRLALLPRRRSAHQCSFSFLLKKGKKDIDVHHFHRPLARSRTIWGRRSASASRLLAVPQTPWPAPKPAACKPVWRERKKKKPKKEKGKGKEKKKEKERKKKKRRTLK